MGDTLVFYRQLSSVFSSDQASRSNFRAGYAHASPYGGKSPALIIFLSFWDLNLTKTIVFWIMTISDTVYEWQKAFYQDLLYLH